MKKLVFEACFGIALLMGTVVTLSSCSEEVTNPENQKVYAPVCVQVCAFSVSMEDFPNTRAAVSPSDYAGVKAMTLAFYDANGEETYKVTQLKSDDPSAFGQFSCSLPVGSYTLVAVAYNCFTNDVFTLTSPTDAAFTSAFPRETFCTTQAVSITDDMPVSLSITLNRINALLAIYSNDQRPADAVYVRTTYSAGCKGFNPSTGLASNANGFSVVNELKEAVGQTVEVVNNAFLATDLQTMDITLEVLDQNSQVLCTKVVPNVPLKRSRMTFLEGNLFSPSSPFTVGFSLNTDWQTSNTVTF